MHHTTIVSGQALTLLPERAIFWEAEQTLVVADAHFGKAALFRARGVPVPEATTADNLARLSELMRRWSPARIVFLGDFSHAPEANSEPTRNALDTWRALHDEVEMILVRGNHDVPDSELTSGLRIDTVEEPWSMGCFSLCHHPQQRAGRYVLAGHVHPAFRLRGRANERARLPCFWFGPHIGVLPAFGDFTGAATIRANAGDRIFLASPAHIHAVPVLGPGA